MKINKKSDLYNANIEEIQAFFKSVIFKGQYKEFPPEREDKRFCGKIEHITINGETNDLCPTSIFVPEKFSQFVKPGLCEFNALPNINVIKEERHQYKLFITRVKNIVQKIVRRDRKAESTFRYNLKLKDDKFVGQFTENKDGSFTIRDIRRSDFSKLILQNGKEQSPIVYHPHLFKPKNGKYYEFSWILNGEKENYVYLFKVDETKSFQEVTPRNLVQRLHDDIMNYPAGAGQKIVKMLDTLKNQLTASGKEIFIYELLQNANDYPQTINDVKQKVDVEFHLTLSSLVFMHSGAVFNEKNIAAICSINDKEKDTNKDAIGYKGIGFKTVFLDNENVYLQTGDYSFRFDRQATRDIVDTPWQILPIWTNYQELTPAERTIFTHASDKFRVKFSLKPTKIETLRNSEHNYAKMFQDIFKNERVILFIPNLSSVKVYLNGTPIPDIVCSRDNASWRVDDFKKDIAPEITEAINSDIDEQEDAGGLKIPTKYYNFNSTKVSFACEIDGRKLKAVKDTCLYCYLPAKDATWGLKFLMNTDMIPNGARDDVEVDFSNSINVNKTIANIAGSKLFEWILKLTKSGEYELDSTYNLIPSFASLKSGRSKYEDLINSFEKGFVDRVETDDFVPTPDGYVCLLNVIVDKTGLTSSGIMSDANFLKFSDKEEKILPILELRNSDSFESFAEVYIRKFDVEENIFDTECLREMIGNDDFKEWLKEQNNNNKFLNFLLENDYLKDYFDEAIFIEEESGMLFSASDLYYNIDEELKDLSAFSSHLCYLSFRTREFFKDNEKWNEIIEDHFAEYDSESFINETLLSDNWDETVHALKEWNTSFHFYSYLAKNNIVPDNLCSLPFFNDEVEPVIVDDFNDNFVFFSSSEGKKTCSESWLSSVTFSFVSPNYDKATLDYFKEHAGVRDYSDDIIVNDIILSEDYHDGINESQQENKETSVAFLKFCYEHGALFSSGSLRDYALNAYDCDGGETFVLYEDHIYFPSECFDECSQKDWLDNDWMYSLDSDYLNVENDEDKVKDFLKEAFYVEELDADKFYKDIVRSNISTIVSNTSGNNDGDGAKNLDFVSYLDANYKLVFEIEKDADKFESFVLVGDSDDDGGYDIDANAAYVYAYDIELKEILDSEWFPTDTVNMCTSKYGESKSILAIKAKKYDFANFFNDVITEELDNINNTISSKDASIAFHAFVIDRLADLTDKQKEVMKGVKVYIYGNEDAIDSSEGHHILSKSARELASMGLVEFSDLDIIDPDYHIEENEEYWKTRLGNEPFTVTDFITWLTDNTDTFYSTIEDKDSNIKFWRWVKGCRLADQTLASLPVLPIYLKTDEYVDSDNIIYLSDEYIEEGGLETIVTSYHPDALFISSAYIEEDDNVEAWKDFWVKMGVRFEMVDILIDTIDNRLSETDDAKLPATIAKYRSKLEDHYEGEGGLISNLQDLRVKAYDGEFYRLSKVIYIDNEKDEPFKYIDIPTQVSFTTADERRLIVDILDEIDGNKITKLTEWQEIKIDRYLEIQDDEDSEDLLRSIHFRFVDELAAMYIADKDSLKEFDQISKVLFLDSDDEFTDVSKMTEGSLYEPFCDFEKYGLDYDYISNSYLQECKNDIRKMLNRVFKIHCNFEEDDIVNLSNRDFSIYFWSQYLTKRDADIRGVKKMIDDKKFDSVACIPTKDYMKKPGEIYSLTISSYVNKHVVDWENKLPLADLPNIEYDKEEKRTLFGLLFNKPSNLHLSFCDSLYALFSITGQDRRAQLLQWIIETYDQKYDVNVAEYRADESAKWKNTKNDDKPIAELYALSYNEKKLEQYFGNLPKIINKEYLPAGPISFKNACDILQITTIEPEDLIVDRIGQVSKNEVYKNTLRVYALVLAGYEDAENWSSRYQKYNELIDALELWCCTAISIRYEKDENICQNLKKFYREKGSADFYFVKSLDEKRVFKPFVENFIEYLGIEADKDFVETVMDSREAAIEIVQENNPLMLDDAFKEELDLLIPGIKRELNGNEADDTDFVDEDKRHIFTGHTVESKDETSQDDNIEDNESTDNNDSEDSELEEEIQENGIESQHKETFDDDDEIEAFEKSDDNEPKKTRSDNGSTHYYPTNREPRERKSSRNVTPTMASEGTSTYSDMNGWEGSKSNYTPQAPKPFSPEDVRNFGSHGVTRTLEVLEPTTSEVTEINRILGEDLSPEQVADQNYLAQLRLYNNLVKRGMTPNESKDDFVRNAHMKNEHTITGGKYIHKCSAAGGIMYLSPSIWNKISDDRCVVCVYLGAKANEFMYFNSIDDILKWIGEDDIVIKLTGEEKADVVEELYSGVLYGVKGTAYTLIRINSSEKYNSLFAKLPTNNDINETEENEDEY